MRYGKLARTAKKFLLVSALVPLACAPARSQTQSFAGNGKGISVGAAVLAKSVPGSNSSPVYQSLPDRWSPAVLGRNKSGGLGLIRLVATPTPLMSPDSNMRAAAIRWITNMVSQANAAGLGIVVDMHFWPSDAPLSQDTVPNDPRRQPALFRGEAELATALEKGGGRVALELMNEPDCAPVAGADSWPVVQRRLTTAVRRAAPNLPLILTGCRGRVDTLIKIDATSYRADRNIYWTFHYYDFFGGQELNKLHDVPFPPNPALANSVSAMHKMLPISTAASNPKIIAQLRDYLINHHGVATIQDQMASVASWADRYAIPQSHIFMGEFAALLNNTQANEAIRPDQLLWLRSVREAAERQGFFWAYWSGGTIDYDPATKFFRKDSMAALGLAPAPGNGN